MRLLLAPLYRWFCVSSTRTPNSDSGNFEALDLWARCLRSRNEGIVFQGGLVIVRAVYGVPAAVARYLAAPPTEGPARAQIGVAAPDPGSGEAASSSREDREDVDR